jgi:2-polyprenyl-6-methoxyphenol hydroxylase-like FAD-dependent oxidoreductase
MNLRTKVLICGAGPTGLMMACQLKRFGIDCLVIDEKAGIVTESRALAVQARTMQIYDQLGIAEEALAKGTRAEKIKIIINARKVYQLPLKKLGQGLSDYAFLFVLEQNKNEKILYDLLVEMGGEVLWKYSLESFVQGDTGVSAIIKNGAGQQNEITADWLIGADGANSRVRHQLQVPFTGETYENIFYVADTSADWPWGHDCLSLCLSSKTFAGLFPMQGLNRFRLIGIFPKQFQQEEVTDFSVIKKTVEEQMNMNVEFTNTNWFCLYRVHHRCVSKFSHGKVFLAGDAAHVHSPAGGQGMNTGLQDGYNLAWKMAMVIKNIAGEKLLESYNEERLPVAKKLVKTTDRAFSIVTSEKWLQKFFRLHILPPLLQKLLSIRPIGLFIFRSISQIGIRYSHSSLSCSLNRELLKAGRLVPFVRINSTRIDEYLKFTGFTILLFKVIITEQERQEIQHLFLADFQFIDITANEINADAYRKFKVKNSGIFLIRPDNYIGFTAEKCSMAEIKEYLTGNLNLKFR